MVPERYRDFFVIYLKGFAMGSADAVPGVSGGTIALITGIYERLIAAITSITGSEVVTVLKGFKPSNYRETKTTVKKVDAHFLAVLGAGILTALVAVLNIVHYFIEYHAVPTFGFFFGLIAVSALILYRQVDLSTPGRGLAAFTGFLAAFLVSGYATTSFGHSFPVLFLAGALAVSAMVLPGISGSLILLIIGQYTYMTGVLSNFTDAFIPAVLSGEFGPLLQASQPVAVFVSGAFVGLFTVAHSVRWALENYRKATVAFLVSLVAGALRAPVVEVEKKLVEEGTIWIQVLPEFALAAVFGGFAIFLLDYKAGVIEY